MSYHDRYLARKKRNPVFRFWFWWESRKLRGEMSSEVCWRGTHHACMLPSCQCDCHDEVASAVRGSKASAIKHGLL